MPDTRTPSALDSKDSANSCFSIETRRSAGMSGSATWAIVKAKADAFSGGVSSIHAKGAGPIQRKGP